MNNSNEYTNKLYDNKKYKEAIIFYKRNIEYLLNENIKNYYKNNSTNLKKDYYNIGVFYIKLKDYDKALENFKLALNYYRDSKYYFNIGYVYVMKQNMKKAYIYFNLAWSLNHNDNDCKDALKKIEPNMSFSNY